MHNKSIIPKKESLHDYEKKLKAQKKALQEDLFYNSATQENIYYY